MARKKGFPSSKEVLSKQKILKDLVAKKKNLELEIKDSNERIEDILNKKISDHSLNKLPIESLKELYVKSESATDILNSHSKERKKNLSFLDEVSKIEHKIEQAKIDLAIEKINNLLQRLQ